MSLALRWRRGKAAEALRRQRFVFVDIGARFGLPPHWEAMGSLLDVLAFEPDEVEARRLTSSLRSTGALVEVVPAAVWDVAGRQTLYLTRNPGCSSLYPPKMEFLREFPDADRFDVVSRVEVETVLLDSRMADPVGRPFRFVKIDAQGGALNILSGASHVLDTALGLEAEIELTPMYQGEPLLGEVDEFLRSRGFELVDLRPTYWRREAARHVAGTRGQVVFCDTLYLLAPQRFAQRLASLDGEAAEQLCASALLICDVYGIADWIASYAAAAEGVNQEARKMLLDHLAARRSFRWPSFPLRFRLGLWLKDVGDGLIESRDTWAVAELRLGSKSRLSRSVASWLVRGFGSRYRSMTRVITNRPVTK
jgi:FkbM family methyltransferase